MATGLTLLGIITLINAVLGFRESRRACHLHDKHVRENENIREYQRRGGAYHLLCETERFMVREGQFPPFKD